MNNWVLLLCFFVSLHGLWAQDPQRSQKRTSIDSDELEMQGTEARNYFYFRGNVRVLGSDLEILCDELTVTSQRANGLEDGTLGELGAIEKIIAVGKVEIEQAGRQATAGRVEVDPSAGTIHFLEDPVIMQDGNEVRAYGFIFYTKEKRFETINPPGFVPGQPTERTTLYLVTADSLSSLVPEEDVSVGSAINDASPTRAELEAAEAVETDSPIESTGAENE